MPTLDFPAATRTVTITAPNVSIYYPQVKKLGNTEVQEKINHTIEKQVYALINEQGYYQHPAATQMQGTYEIKTNERGILSLTVENYAYTTPSAHGLTLLKSLTADIRTGTFYQLNTLFKPGSDYIKKISEIIAVQIKQRNIQLLNGFTAIRPDQDFYIADKALVVYFQLYEITPYYVGFPMFPISVYDLESIIDESSPLSRMLPA